MSTKYKISYDDNRTGIFYAGETMKGKVTLTLAKDKKLMRIYLQIKGYAKTQWQSGSGKSKVHHVGKEKYFATKIDLIPETGSAQQFEPGTYDYYFSHYLSHTLPSSFESNVDGVKAFIRYTAKLVLVRPWRNQTFKEGFTVLNHYDLNTLPHLLVPERQSVAKHFTWSSKGPITAEASIPMSGFVPGENIPVMVKIKNESNKNETDFEVQIILKQLIQATSTHPFSETKMSKRHVVTTQVPGIPKDKEEVYNAVLQVPSLPPTNTLLCNLIQMHYALFIKIRLFGTHTNVKASMPLTIGTIPFRGTHEMIELWGGERNTTIITGRGELPSYNEAVGTPDGEPNEILPPPTYENSVFGDVDLENEDHTHFAPRYPVYHYDTLPSRPGERKGSVYKFQTFD